MNHTFLQHHQGFERDTRLGLGYSFIRNTTVSYTLIYDDTRVFAYKKTLLQSPECVQEEYIGSDSLSGMTALIDSSDVTEAGIPYGIIAKTRKGIMEESIVEIHYSHSILDQDFTLYIYSEDIVYLESILGTTFAIPSLDLIAREMSMYCLKLKIKKGLSEYIASIVFTSKNNIDGSAANSLPDSYFFAGGFGDIVLPPIINSDDLFYTFEVAYNLTSRLIENFILFYILRYKPNAKSTPL